MHLTAVRGRMQAVIAHAVSAKAKRWDPDSVEGAHEQLPHDSEWKLVDEFDKTVSGDHTWKRRRAVLTRDMIFFSRIYSTEITDRVDLLQITELAVEEAVEFAARASESAPAASSEKTFASSAQIMLGASTTSLVKEMAGANGGDLAVGDKAAKTSQQSHCLNITKSDEWGRISHTVGKCGVHERQTQHIALEPHNAMANAWLFRRCHTKKNYLLGTVSASHMARKRCAGIHDIDELVICRLCEAILSSALLGALLSSSR